MCNYWQITTIVPALDHVGFLVLHHPTEERLATVQRSVEVVVNVTSCCILVSELLSCDDGTK